MISGKGVHIYIYIYIYIYICMGVRFVDFISFFSNIP